MRKKTFIFFYSLFIFNCADGQLRENFNDGDFSKNPAWTGDTTDFIVNDGLQLQSSNTTAGNSFYLSTMNEIATNAEWEFWIRLAFNPSSANYVDAYLTASSENLKSIFTTGYFVRIGNTEDEISLYRKNADGTNVKIIDGENGILNHSNNILKIKIIRDKSNQWTLYRDLSGTGNNYIKEGTAADSTYNTSAYFGFLIKQSTSSFFQKHFFDDIIIKKFVPDTIPPQIQSAIVISNTEIDLSFDKPLEKTSSELFSNFSSNNQLGMPASVILDPANPRLIHLSFDKSFTNGMPYTLNINGVKDLFGNEIVNGKTTFVFYLPQIYDVIIDEIFPDPNPQVGLPLFKYLELKNVAAFPINLKDWKLMDGNSTATLPSYNLLPDSFVIVCANNSATSYLPYGPTIGVANFPAMNIAGATIILRSADNKTIHAVQYDLNSYKNEIKKAGGWTLEMIDTKKPCAGPSNWKASIDASGGTPGRKNSLDGSIKDETAPKLLRSFVTDKYNLSLVFDKSLDSIKAASVSSYMFDKNLTAKNITVTPPFFEVVNITLNKPVEEGITYNVIAKNISDCAENLIGIKNSAKFGLAQSTDSMDLVINEILFNPLPNGADYVELYNRSKKIIDLKKIFIANRNSRNEISSLQQITPETVLLFPDEFILLTTDADVVISQYMTTNPDAFLQMDHFPSFPNSNGNVIVLNNQGSILDEVPYSEKWHFPLIKNVKGVSLERVDYHAPSIQSNFHSAATSVGYGTPGYKNSQYQITEEMRVGITVIPEIFSPDNDGKDDFVTINYSFPSAGYVANITVFDASGRPVRYLQKNSVSGIKGTYRWDGLDDKNRKLAQGIYIIYTEIFNTEGKKKAFKNTVVLARRF
ncbi:MAG: lamin tail domain-containing protein [Ginsengibacter sp.]